MYASLPPTSDHTRQNARPMPEHIALAPDFNSPAIDGATLAESTRFQSEAAVTNPQAERPDTQPVAPENTTSSPATAAG